MILKRTARNVSYVDCDVLEVCKACKFMNSIIYSLSGYDCNIVSSHTLKMHPCHMFLLAGSDSLYKENVLMG